MNSDWAVQSVGELEAAGILLVQDGNHGEYRPRHEEITRDGTPHIRAADISDAGIIDFTGAQRINDAALARIRKGVGASGDVLLTHKGTVGRVARVPDDAPHFVCSPQTTLWRSLDQDQLDQAFLFAYLRSPSFASQLRRRMHESDMAPYVSLTAQRSFVIPIPHIGEQRRIAQIVSALDNKIDSNRRLAALLEEAAATLFRARFVDFVDLDDFEDSEIGPIPYGWRVGALTDLARFVNGKAFTKYANGRGRPIIRIRELKDGIDQATPQSDIDAANDSVADFDDILFAWSGSLGAYRWPGEQALINQHIFKVIPENWPAWYVFSWIEEHMETFRAIARDKATTMGHIQRRHLSDARVPLPPPDVIQGADEVVGPLDRRRAVLARESRTLHSVRDALLPKLVSGQMRVPEAFDGAEVTEPALA
jgi:type I restriction enzyme S subunit